MVNRVSLGEIGFLCQGLKEDYADNIFDFDINWG